MKLALASIFGDGMVIQRDVPAPVWGRAVPGDTITVTLGDVSIRTHADAGGQWRADLPAAPAGGPYTMTVRSGTDTVRFAGVYRGEVWLTGGQSNMELPLERSEHGAEAVRNSKNPDLHVCIVPRTAQEPPRTLSWHTADPSNAGEMSAVAYYAAQALSQHLENVPVGVIVCCWGATYAQCWIAKEALLRFPTGARHVADYDRLVGDKPDEVFEREQAAYQKETDAWNARPEGPYPWPPPAGKPSFHYPGNLYRAMLKPLAPYALRGFWYYQGEQDEVWSEDYYLLLTSLIRCWRDTWEDPALPFLLVQLPMYIAREALEKGDPMCWPVLRKAQADAAKDLPGVELAVLADCGEFDNVHPADKRTPGTRLGLLALEAVYRRDVTGRSPTLAEATLEEDTVLLRFDHVGGGLRLDGGGFQTAGDDGVFADVPARVAGPDTVQLAAARPRAVRYAWYSFGPAGLHGGTGLAAAPFEYYFDGTE